MKTYFSTDKLCLSVELRVLMKKPLVFFQNLSKFVSCEFFDQTFSQDKL